MSNNNNNNNWVKVNKKKGDEQQQQQTQQHQNKDIDTSGWKSGSVGISPVKRKDSGGNNQQPIDMVSILSAPPPPTLRVYDPQSQFNQSSYSNAVQQQMIKDDLQNNNNNNSNSESSSSLNSSTNNLHHGLIHNNSSNSLNSLNDSLNLNRSITNDLLDQERLKKILNEEDDDDVEIDETIDINEILMEEDDDDLINDVEEMIGKTSSSGSALTDDRAPFSPIHGSSPSLSTVSSTSSSHPQPVPTLENGLPMLWANKNSRRSFNGIVVEPQFYTKISEQLSSPSIRKETGYPTCFSTSKYICIGSSHGYLLIFNYNQELVSIIGGAICADSGSVTAIDQPSCKVNEEWMVSGHQNGQIILWDVPTGKPLKVVAGVHKHPILHLRFFADGNRFVSSDAHGVTNIITITRGFMSMGFDQQLLLNGNLGPVLSIAPLLPGNFPHPTDRSFVFALATKRKILIISASLEGGVSILNNKITKPTYVKATGVLPYLSWRRVTFQRNLGHTKPLEPILAIGWGTNVQLLQIVTQPTDLKFANPEFIVVAEYQTNSEVCGLEWMDAQTILFLNNKYELRVFDPFALEEVESVNIKSMQLIHHSKFQSVYSFHNSIRTHKSRIYMLGLNGLFSAHILTWLERLSVLVSNQQWFEALCLALDFYEGKAKATTGLSSNTIDCKLLTGDKIIEMISQLCQIVFNSSFHLNNNKLKMGAVNGLAHGNGMASGESSPSMNMLKSSCLIPKTMIDNEAISGMTMYQQLALICIEFCVTIKRTDFLFGEVFNYFVEGGMVPVILEFLEPYILRDRLVHLNPEVMQFMMNHYQEKGILLRAEQCLLHLDIASLDFHQTVILCRKHHLYSALIYLYNKGLNDYITPLEDMMEMVVVKPRENGQGESGSKSPTPPSSHHLSLVADVSRRLLQYLRFSLSGRSFPSGQPIAASRIPSLKMEIYEYLFLRNIFPEDPTPYPRLFNLLKLDTLEMINILSLSFDDQFLIVQSNQQQQQQQQQQSQQVQVTSPKAGTVPSSLSALVIPAIPFNVNRNNLNHHTMLAVLLLIMIDRSQTPLDPHSNEEWAFTIEQQGQLCVLLANCIEKRLVKSIEPTLLSRLIGILAVPPLSFLPIYNQSDRQSSLLSILVHSSPKDYDTDKLLILAEGNELYRVAQFLYSQQHQYAKMVVCQIRDPDTRSQTFDYVRSLLENPTLNDIDRQNVRQTTISNLAQLIVVDSTSTAQLIMDYFASDHEKIVKELGQFPKLQYTYLVGLLGNDSSSRIAIQQRTGIQISNDTYELYIKLMCMFSPDSVYKYLVSHDDYPLDACLKICQQYNNFEGATYLLERTGDVNKALDMILIILKRKIEDIIKHFTNIFANVKSLKNDTKLNHSNPIEKEIMDALNASIALCQRNSQKLQTTENEMIWFRLLDTIVAFLRKIKQSNGDGNGDAVIENNVIEEMKGWSRGSLSNQSSPMLSSSPLSSSSSSHSSSILTSSANFSLMSTDVGDKPKSAVYIKCTSFLNRLIHIILNSMMGSVALPLILTKIVNDHGSDEFGDFKAIITGMLDTCTFETSILSTANQLIQNDMYNTTLSYITKRTKAYSPDTTRCVMCTRPLQEFPNSSNTQQSPLDLIVVFQCNHSIHSTCMGRHSVCPLCSKEKEKKKDKGTGSNKGKEVVDNTATSSPIVFDPKKIRQDRDDSQKNSSVYLDRLANYSKQNKRQPRINVEIIQDNNNNSSRRRQYQNKKGH